MHVELIAYTQRNPALTAETVAGLGDLPTLWDGKGTYAENVMEYAGRVCYRSTHRMGAAPDFIADRVREGHEDIIEHIVITVRITNSVEPLHWRMLNRHCEVSDVGDGAWIVSGNTARMGGLLPARDCARSAAGGARRCPGRLCRIWRAPPRPPANPSISTWRRSRPPHPFSPPKTAPCASHCWVTRSHSSMTAALLLHHGSATFLFEGISRTCTHQFVRHRLASFSQESQRYVELAKGGWNAIVPPAVAENPTAMAELAEFWQMAEAKYRRLRQLGIRKEDARFLLPNAAETRIVATMNFAAWSHFLWLRAVDKAAQWEIRAMGQRALEMLYAVAPSVFAEQWQIYQEKFIPR